MKRNLLIIGILVLVNLSVICSAAEQESILDRVSEIRDPELGELIRRALANSPGLEHDRAGKAKLVRRVTESYLLIKKLDSQMAELNVELDSPETSEADKLELRELKAELQAELTKQMAVLREAMNLVPQAKYRHSMDAFNTWLAFDVTGDDSVCVYRYSQPFFERKPDTWSPTESDCSLDGILTLKGAVEYLRGLVRSNEHFPVRVDIFRNSAGSEASDRLKADIDWIIKSENLQWQELEVFFNEQIRPKADAMEVVIKQDGVFWLDDVMLARGRQEVIDWFKSHVSSKVNRPGGLPFRLYIQFDDESEDLAIKSAGIVRNIAAELRLSRDFLRVVLLRDSFGHRESLEDLNSWLLLDVISDAVYVLKVQEPFNWYNPADPVRLMSQREAISYIRDLAEVEERLPMRITIFRNTEGEGSSRGLFNRVVRLIKDMNTEGQVWACLDGPVRPSGTKDRFTLKQGKWYRGVGDNVSSQPLDNELPNFISNLTSAQTLPYELRIEFDHESKDLAKDIVQIMEKGANELALEQNVRVEAEAVNSVRSWLALDVIEEDTVFLYGYSKPYRVPMNPRTESQLVSIASLAETLDFIKDFISDDGNLPLWLDIHRSEAGSSDAEELYRQIVEIFREAGLSTDTQVYLDRETHAGDYNREKFSLRKRYVNGSDEPSEIDSDLYLNELNRPKCLPYKLYIEYDRRSKDLAVKVGRDVSQAAKAVGIERLVEIKLSVSEP